MKALLGTAVVTGSLALFAPTVAAAVCAQWDVSQRWTAVQKNYYHVNFDLYQDRSKSTVSGIAGFLGSGNFYHSGPVTGTIKGDSIELFTSWGGVYVGHIDATGRIDGTTYDERDSTSSSTWYSNRRMNCRATATPPSQPLSVPNPYADLLTAKGGVTDPTSLQKAMEAAVAKASLQGRLVSALGVAPSPPVAAPTPGTPVLAATAAAAQTPVHVPSGPVVPAPDLGAIRPAPEGSSPARSPKSGACKQGYVWRKGRPTDRVCVTPHSAARVAQENYIRAKRVQPGGGAYGPNTCRSGFVWREAFVGDLVCVTPKIRALVAEENRLGPSRRVH
jgi:hypothetical protein